MLRFFRLIALLEAISAVVLFFVAMPLKYFWQMPLPVRIAGSIHGALFVAFVILLFVCWQKYTWNISRVLIYFVLSIFPIISFWIEIDLKKIIKGEKV